MSFGPITDDKCKKIYCMCNFFLQKLSVCFSYKFKKLEGKDACNIRTYNSLHTSKGSEKLGVLRA